MGYTRAACARGGPYCQGARSCSRCARIWRFRRLSASETCAPANKIRLESATCCYDSCLSTCRGDTLVLRIRVHRADCKLGHSLDSSSALQHDRFLLVAMVARCVPNLHSRLL